MKKHISILMLASAFAILSCERESDNSEISEERINKVQKRENQSKAESAPTLGEQVGLSSKETGDDEPQDDKQHWRIQNDSIS